MIVKARHLIGRGLLPALLVLLSAGAAVAWGQGSQAPAAPERTGLLDLVRAGGWVGYLILLLSLAGVAMVSYAALRIRQDQLIPPTAVLQFEDLARRGRFSEMLTLAQASDSLLARILAGGLAEGTMGLAAVRQSMQDEGVKQVTRLQQRVGMIGLIAAIAPLLGLLGTVTGMVGSFGVLGTSRGAARPDQLAVGIAEALVTTCMGLILAVPLMLCHSYFRDRVTRIGQEAASVTERVLRLMNRTLEANLAARQQSVAATPAAPQPMPQPMPAAQG